MRFSFGNTAALMVVVLVVTLSPASSQDASRQTIAFSAKHIAPLVAIREIGIQSHVPIGIVFGANQAALCEKSASFDLRQITPRYALEQAAQLVNYSVEQHDDVFLMMAPDVNSHQRSLIDHRFTEFHTEAKVTMHRISAQLTGWLWTSVDGAQGFGGSTLDSTTAHTIELPRLEDVTTEQIADRIVTIPPGGIWVLQGNTHPPLLPDSEGRAASSDPSVDRIDFYSWAEPEQVRRDLVCPTTDSH